jgi:uncharacterized membrane protein YhhN
MVKKIILPLPVGCLPVLLSPKRVEVQDMSQELLLALIYLLFMTRSEPTLLRSAVKTGSIALLAVVALPIPLLALALGVSALGDLALSRNGERAFLAGIGAFALAHLAYLTVFLSLEGEATPAVGWQVAAGIVIACFSSAMAWLLWSRAGPLRWPVLGYVGIIAVMAISSLLVPAPYARPVIAAAFFFVLSDSLIATERFLIAAAPAPRWLPPAIWLTYWLAQFFFCVGIAQIL